MSAEPDVFIRLTMEEARALIGQATRAPQRNKARALRAVLRAIIDAL